MGKPLSPYEVLGIEEDASDADITKAFRKESMKCNASNAASAAQRKAMEARQKELNVAKDDIETLRGKPEFTLLGEEPRPESPPKPKPSAEQKAGAKAYAKAQPLSDFEMECATIAETVILKHKYPYVTSARIDFWNKRINQALINIALMTVYGRNLAMKQTIARDNLNKAKRDIFSHDSLSAKFQSVATAAGSVSIPVAAYGLITSNNFIATPFTLAAVGGFAAKYIARAIDDYRFKLAEMDYKDALKISHDEAIRHGEELYSRRCRDPDFKPV